MTHHHVVRLTEHVCSKLLKNIRYLPLKMRIMVFEVFIHVICAHIPSVYGSSSISCLSRARGLRLLVRKQRMRGVLELILRRLTCLAIILCPQGTVLPRATSRWQMQPVRIA